jgi:hypothetical protein
MGEGTPRLDKRILSVAGAKGDTGFFFVYLYQARRTIAQVFVLYHNNMLVFRCLALLVLVSAISGGPIAVGDQLQTELQTLLDTLANQSGFAIQLGVKTPDYEFSIASGNATVVGKQTKDITIHDTMAFGSATKPYTATTVMQLIEKVSGCNSCPE